MGNVDRLSKKNFYILVTLSGIIILLSSFEAILKVKDYELFLMWAKDNFPQQSIDQSLFNTYVTSELSIYLIKVLIPISISIMAFFALTRIRYSKIFVYVWTVLAMGGFAYTLFDFNLRSVFYYSILLLYIILTIFLYLFMGMGRESSR